MSVTLKQIEAFVRVADLRSFRRAAEQLNTTQPNISARIAAFEAALGATLMERDAGSVRLTHTGRVVLDRARGVLAGMQEMLGAVGDTALVEGVLRLGVTELVVQTWLGGFLSALKDRFPNVLVELTVDISANLSRALLDRSLDLTFQNGPFARQVSGTVALRAYPFVWVAAPAHGLSSDRLSRDDVLRHPVLTHARGTLPYDQLAAHLALARPARARLVPSSNLAACQQMAMDGYGLACLPRAMVVQALAQGRLQELHYDWLPDPLLFAARFDAERGMGFVTEAAELAKEIANTFDKNS